MWASGCAGVRKSRTSLKPGQRAGDEIVGGAGGAFVGVVDYDDGVVGEMRDCERDAVILIGERMAAVVEVRADACGSHGAAAKNCAEVHVVECDLAGRGVSVEGAAKCVRGAVELREIVACEDSRAVD